MHCGHVCMLRAERWVVCILLLFWWLQERAFSASAVSPHEDYFNSTCIRLLSHGPVCGRATSISATGREWLGKMRVALTSRTLVFVHACTFQRSRLSPSLTVGTTVGRVNAFIILYVTPVAQPRESVSDTDRLQRLSPNDLAVAWCGSGHRVARVKAATVSVHQRHCTLFLFWIVSLSIPFTLSAVFPYHCLHPSPFRSFKWSL
jgi:hypothetical protein